MEAKGQGRNAGILIGLPMVLALTCPGWAQEAEPGLRASAVVEKDRYLLDPSTEKEGQDRIKVVISVANPESGFDVVTSEGFLEQRFHLFLTCVDPDGQAITALEGDGKPEGLSPLLLRDVDEVVPVAPTTVIEPGTVRTTTMPEMRAYYPLTKAGFYRCRLAIPFVRYEAVDRFIGSQGFVKLTNEAVAFGGLLQSTPPFRFALVADADRDGYCFPVQDQRLCRTPQPDCDDGSKAVHPGRKEMPKNGIDDDCDASTLDHPPVVPGTVLVRAVEQQLGQPDADVDQAIAALPLRLFDLGTGSCVGGSVKQLVPRQYRNIWRACATLPQLIGRTGEDGTVRLAVPPGEYLLIGQYVRGKERKKQIHYVGMRIGTIGEGQTRKELLRVIIRPDGSIVSP